MGRWLVDGGVGGGIGEWLMGRWLGGWMDGGWVYRWEGQVNG